MAVHLPNVYGIIVDKISGSAATNAVQKTLDQVKFGGFAFLYPRENTLAGVQCIMWHEAWTHTRRCSHILFFQYDGWVINGDAWDPSWLEYDYIGAPWPWHQYDRSVGNGGFSLRSVRLMQFLSENRDLFPVSRTTPEDDHICRGYRPQLEEHGFRWAPRHVAEKFSCERGPWRTGTFGFHGIYNIPKVLAPDEWISWRASANDYIRSKPEWGEVT